MAARKYEGINKLPISLVARLILEEAIVKLLKGDEDEYLITSENIADELGVPLHQVKDAIDELRESKLVAPTNKNLGDGATALRLKWFSVHAEIVAPPQPRLDVLDEQAPPKKKTREEVGKDEAEVDGTLYKAVVTSVEDPGAPFELNITRGSHGFLVVAGARFGSKEEAWGYFDEFVGKIPKFEQSQIWTRNHVIDGDPFSSVLVKLVDSEMALVVEVLSVTKFFALDKFLSGIEGDTFVYTVVEEWVGTVLPTPESRAGFDAKGFPEDVIAALGYAMAEHQRMQAHKPEGAETAPDGDWVCPACEANNFASSRACVCGAPRPAGAKVVAPITGGAAPKPKRGRRKKDETQLAPGT